MPQAENEMKRPPMDVLLSGQDSGDRLALVEMVVNAGFAGPPLHVHETWDEGFYVLDGEVTIQAGDEIVTATSGMFAFAPLGTPHTFANLTDRDARILLVLTPAGFERYLTADAAERGSSPPNSRAVGPSIGGYRHR